MHTMNHLDEFQLNEYLDGTLDTAAQAAVEEHLTVCAGCRAALAELQAVFLALDAVEEAALTADLSAQVVSRWRTQTPPEPAPWLRPLLLLQLAGAIGMVVWLWPVIGEWITRLETVISAIQPIRFDFGQRAVVWVTAVSQQLQSARPAINLAPGQWALLIGLALLAWLAASRLVLNDEG